MQSRVKLPKLELRVFAGELKDWLGWRAHFATIDQSSEKFQYLTQAVVGEPRGLVEGFPSDGGQIRICLEVTRNKIRKLLYSN